MGLFRVIHLFITVVYKLINSICLFGVGGARRRPHRAPSLRHTQGFLPQLPLVPIACFLPWCSFFPSHKRLRFHLIYPTIVRLSFVCGSLVGAVQVSQRVLFFSLANEWHNKRTILLYARAECVPPRSGSVGSLKRRAEGERNRGNTVRKRESCI